MLDRTLRCRARRAALLALVAVIGFGCGLGDPLEKVRRLQENGDYAASIEPLRKLIEARPEDAEVSYRYGAALAVTGEPELAKWSLRKAMESEQWFEQSAALLARALLTTGNYDESVEVCNRLLERKPDDIATLLVRADAHVGSRREYEAALADAERVLEIDPENVDALVPRAVSLLALDREKEANEALEKLEELYRDDSLGLHGSAGLCTARATFAKEKGDLKLAAERYDACLATFPGWGWLVQDAVEFFDGQGKSEHAQEILEKAVEASSTDGELRAALADRLEKSGEIERAKEVMRAGTQAAAPEDAAGGWAALGSFLLEHGDLEEAADALAKARELDPTGSPNLLFAYADAAVVAGRYDEALRLAELMTVPAHRELVEGRVALSRHEPKQALEHFTKGIRLWPNNAFARYYAAVAAEQVGSFDRAIEEYRSAMRVDPKATDAYLRLARLHAAAGRDSYAIAALTFEPGGRQREEEAWLLEMQILARLGRVPETPKPPKEDAAQEKWSAGIAALARGIADRGGPKAAIQYLNRTDPTAFDDPSHAAVAELWIANLAASGRASEAVAKIEAGARRHPEAASLHALHGDALRLAGADRARVRAVYQKALELDSEDARALRGLAGLEAEQGANDAALALYDRALAADPDSPDTMRAAANVLIAAGRGNEAEDRLAELLRDHPYDAEAALTLATRFAARDADPAQTRDLARRAVRFGGGPTAKAFLDKLRADQKADPKADQKSSAPVAAPVAPTAPTAPAAAKQG